jgi:acyl carrier protein
MHDTVTRLKTCFQTVFPSLPEESIIEATQSAVAEWDSLATITLVNVIEEEFGIQVDYDLLPQFDSFRSLREYLRSEKQLS